MPGAAKLRHPLLCPFLFSLAELSPYRANGAFPLQHWAEGSDCLRKNWRKSCDPKAQHVMGRLRSRTSAKCESHHSPGYVTQQVTTLANQYRW